MDEGDVRAIIRGSAVGEQDFIQFKLIGNEDNHPSG